MAEYIKKQDALEIIKSYWHESYDTVSAYILDVPAADARPVVHGKWEGYTRSTYRGMDKDGEPIYRDITLYYCSECRRRSIIYENYCPNCGAKMDFGGSD